MCRILHHEAQSILVKEGRFVCDDIRMINCGKEVDFVNCVLFVFFRNGIIKTHDLHRELLLRLFVCYKVHN